MLCGRYWMSGGAGLLGLQVSCAVVTVLSVCTTPHARLLAQQNLPGVARCKPGSTLVSAQLRVVPEGFLVRWLG